MTHVLYFSTVADYLQELVKKSGLPITLGIVQTAYANGNSTAYIAEQLVCFTTKNATQSCDQNGASATAHICMLDWLDLVRKQIWHSIAAALMQCKK
jgi:hypothetical protein